MHSKNLLVSVVACLCVVACSQQVESVSASDCDKVVAHVKSVLKDNAPSDSKMMQQCKSASDKVRACAMNADKAMKLLQCDF